MTTRLQQPRPRCCAALAIALFLAACSTAVDTVDLDAAEVQSRLAELPPQARERVAELREQLDERPAAEGWMELAMTVHANGEAGLAAELYETAVALDAAGGTVAPVAAYLRSHALWDAGAGEAAIASLTEIVDGGSDYLPAFRTLANWHLEQGRLDTARALARTAHQRAPGDPGVTAVLARIEMAAGDWEAAQELLAHPSPSPQGRDYLAYLGARARQAIEPSGEALRPVREPRWSDLWLERLAPHRSGAMDAAFEAEAALGRGEPRVAIERLEPELRWQPDNPRVRQVLALAYRAAGDLDRALELLTEGVERQPEVLEHRLHLAATQVVAAAASGEAEHLDAALATAIAARDTWPDDWRSHAILGDALNAGRRMEEALSAYADCARLAPRSIAGCELKVARSQLALGRPEDAVASLTDAYGDPPDSEPAARLLEVAKAMETGGR